MHGSPLLVRRSVVGGLSVLALAGCGSGVPRIEVRAATVPVPMTMDVASVYLTIENTGDGDDQLLAVSSTAAEAVELHETTIAENGRASMAPLRGITIPAGETVDFRPGGRHLMLVGIDELVDGGQVPLRLTFRHSGVRKVTAVVTDDIDDVVGA